MFIETFPKLNERQEPHRGFATQERMKRFQ
jgi:hypothetical protein